MNEEFRRIGELAEALEARLGAPPEVAVVLGSGWMPSGCGGDRDDGIPLSDFPAWPHPRVEGHGGTLLSREIGGRRALLCSGRVHSYEGWSARELVRGVRGMHRWGVRRFLLLNAAGSLREDLPPGTLMPFSDHLNLGLPNPLAADQSEDGGALFLDLVNLYDPEWRAALLAAQPELRPGVYAGLPGPSYETPAEVRALADLGADAVGMSTIPEALAAHATGARVLAISMLTNFAAGIGGSRPSHQEVLDTSSAHSESAWAALSAAVATAPT